MAEYTQNGNCRFNLGLQTLQWNSPANIFTSDPAGLEGEALTAVTVVDGDAVGDAYDTTYYTYGEGPVDVVLRAYDDTTVYVGKPYFRVEGTEVNVRPTQDMIDAGRVGTIVDLDTKLTVPTTPAPITGAQGTDDTAILVAVLGALDMLGLIDDQTTGAE